MSNQNVSLTCVDPDFSSVNPDGTTYYMSGTMAKRHQEIGGKCVYFGKPQVSVVEEGIYRLRSEVVSKNRMTMIGDSLQHDVTGSNAVGLDSLLLLGGVHRIEL